MGEPGYPDQKTRAYLAETAAKAYDAINNDEEDKWERPDDDLVMAIFIAYARLIGARP